MEKIATFALLAFLTILLIRTLMMPIKLGAKIGLHSCCGFLCLWLLNTVSGITGLYLPINAVTVLISGFLGLPGLGLIAGLELL